jgi:hypothetical protein
MVARPTLDDVRAGIWTVRCLTKCRFQLNRRDVHQINFPPSGAIGVTGKRAVSRLLRDREDKCLSNALIAQAWRADHGDPVDVLIGVASPGSGFSAHAWLADADPIAAAGHAPIHRIPPKVGGTAPRG